MTTLIQQRGDNDCVLAAIAMAAGKSSWFDLWTEDDLNEVIASKGISDWEKWLHRAGFGEPYKGYWEVYVHVDSMYTTKALLKWRPALLSVHSLNNEGGSHAVYWDGERIWDPQEGRPGKLAMPFLHSALLTRCFLFNPQHRAPTP